MCSTVAALVKRCGASVICSTQALQLDGVRLEGGPLPDRHVTGSLYEDALPQDPTAAAVVAVLPREPPQSE